MHHRPTRRDVIGGVGAILGIGFLPEGALWAQSGAPAPHPGFPIADAEVVKALVTVAHTDFAEVRRLVERQPALARASWDWGYGDWETGLGAAAHTGRRETAELLLAHGARPTIFSAAMMGHLDVVRAFIAVMPTVARTLGPHGLPLMVHARAGGAAAQGVVKYLETVPDASRPPASEPLSNADRDSLVGRYTFGAGARDVFDVDVRQDQLGLQRPGTSRRFLIHTGNLMFFPSGVPSVRIVFAREAARVTRFTISDPDVLLTASRV